MKKLGEILLEAGILTQEQFQATLAEQRKRKKRLGEVIVDMGYLSEIGIAQALSTQLGYPFVDLKKESIDPEAVALLDEEMARSDLIFPYRLAEHTVYIAMADPLSFSTIDDVRFRSGFKVEPVIATTSDILATIDGHYDIVDSLNNVVSGLGYPAFLEVMSADESAKDVTELKKKGEAPPIVRTVNAVISSAINCRASDIHIEPQKNMTVIRNRIDGLLKKALELPKWVHPSIVSRIKIMADLDISEKRLPQDGRIRVRSTDFEVDLRVSTLPTRVGEKVEIRLLNSQKSFKPLEELGLSDNDYKRIKKVIGLPQGVTIVTGPTGSGKSTTLYAFLQHVQSETTNIVTLEDPVEYEMEGVSQVQISEKSGLTFPICLRSVLRQDPDVIMVGEMRDMETAEIAMRASLTGHLVFSTLHTNDAVSTITRLVDIGIPRYLISSSLSAIVSQRLVRKICADCKESYEASKDELAQLLIYTGTGWEGRLCRGKGCKKCEGSGYFDRISIFEILTMNKTLRDIISSGKDAEALEEAARCAGMSLLWEDAVQKVLEGVTTLEEIERVAHKRDGQVFICPSCGRHGKDDYHLCPYCGYRRIDICPTCDRPMEKGWHYCPYCVAHLEEEPEGPPSPPDRVAMAPSPPVGKEGAVSEKKKSSVKKVKGSFKLEKPTLLIAEGDRGIRKRLEKVLEKRISCHLLSVSSGSELMMEVEKGRPDLIIVDYNLPDAKGMLESLKESEVIGDTPLLLIADEDDVAQKLRLLNLGADDLLIKPFSDEEFLNRVGFLWEGSDIAELDDGLEA